MKQPKFSNETRKHLARTVVSAAMNGEKLTVQTVKQPKRKRVRESWATLYCPINERTADGYFVGRCWFYLPDGKTCPRHGDVTDAVKRFVETKELTAEAAKEKK